MQELAWNPATVEVELMKAGRTLMALHVPGIRPAEYRTAWPPYVREATEGYGYEAEPPRAGPPSARQIAHMDVVLAWVRLIPEERVVFRRIVGARMLCKAGTTDPEIDHMVANGRAMVSYRNLAHRLGASDRAVMNWHRQAIGIIVDALNRPGLCKAGGGPIGPSRSEVESKLRLAMARDSLRTPRKVPVRV